MLVQHLDPEIEGAVGLGPDPVTSMSEMRSSVVAGRQGQFETRQFVERSKREGSRRRTARESDRATPTPHLRSPRFFSQTVAQQLHFCVSNAATIVGSGRTYWAQAAEAQTSKSVLIWETVGGFL
jgi:hypothetical protein